MGKSYTSFNPEGVETDTEGVGALGIFEDLGPKSFGLQRGASPIIRSFTLGLNIDF